jgi:hypothetical protein
MLSGVATILTAFTGCLEIVVRTRISGDGSVDRSVSVKRSEKTLPERAYPLSTDPSWSGEWRETGDRDMRYEYTARKSFASPAEFESEYAGRPDTGAVHVAVSLTERGGWFFTTFEYREVYALRNPFRRIPPAEHFTPDELERIGRGEKNDTLNVRVEQWDYRNVFEEYVARLGDGIGEGDAIVNRASIGKAKEELFRLTREDTATDGGPKSRAALRLLAAALRTKTVSKYEGAVARAIAVVDSMQDARKSADVWTSSLVMPGTLVSSNADSTIGGELRWSFEAKRLLVADRAMEASSRVTNTWAFVVTGGAVVLLLVPVVMAMRRRAASG